MARNASSRSVAERYPFLPHDARAQTRSTGPPASPTRCTRRCASISAAHVIVPGQRLQEATLALQLGVSRTPVREALARLESDGLIAAEGRSFVVPVLSDADVDEIYELRGLLEPAALAQVAESVADPKTLARIADALRAAEAADRSADAEAFIEANARFHARLARPRRQSPAAARDRALCRARALPARADAQQRRRAQGGARRA